MKFLAVLLLLFSLSACTEKNSVATINNDIFSRVQKQDVVVVFSPNGAGLQEEDTLADLLCVKPTTGTISSEYGMRRLKGAKPRMHRGVDIKANRGTPVLAAGEGKVIFSGRRGTFGNLVEIQHSDGTITRYAHLDKFSVKRGQQVKAGAALGTVGKTGRTTGYNLHFEVLVEDEHVDPLSIVSWA